MKEFLIYYAITKFLFILLLNKHFNKFKYNSNSKIFEAISAYFLPLTATYWLAYVYCIIVSVKWRTIGKTKLSRCRSL